MPKAKKDPKSGKMKRVKSTKPKPKLVLDKGKGYTHKQRRAFQDSDALLSKIRDAFRRNK